MITLTGEVVFWAVYDIAFNRREVVSDLFLNQLNYSSFLTYSVSFDGAGALYEPTTKVELLQRGYRGILWMHPDGDGKHVSIWVADNRVVAGRVERCGPTVVDLVNIEPRPDLVPVVGQPRYERDEPV